MCLVRCTDEFLFTKYLRNLITQGEKNGINEPANIHCTISGIQFFCSNIKKSNILYFDATRTVNRQFSAPRHTVC